VSQHSNLTQQPVRRLAEADLLGGLTQSDPASDNLNNDMLDAAISRVLARWQEFGEKRPSAAHFPSDTVAAAKMIYGARRKIDNVFGVNGFSVSPAWDIMLDLYAAHFSNTAISISSACIGAACPPTTGLRWLQILERQGLIAKTGDTTDGRRSFCSLTDRGISLTEKAITASLSSF